MNRSAIAKLMREKRISYLTAKAEIEAAPKSQQRPEVSSGELVAEAAARRRGICTSLAYKASNYYDALYLRTGNTAADNMTELAEIFEAEWLSKHGSESERSATGRGERSQEAQ